MILATNPNAEGDATAHYLADRLRGSGVRTTRIAYGMPLGGDLEYADHVTIGRSLAESPRPRVSAGRELATFRGRNLLKRGPTQAEGATSVGPGRACPALDSRGRVRGRSAANPQSFQDLRIKCRCVDTQLVIYDEDYRKILGVIERLVRDANAKGVFVVDKNGQLIGEAGEMRGIDTTSLASLTAGCIAATGGLAKIIGEEEFPIHFHQGAARQPPHHAGRGAHHPGRDLRRAQLARPGAPARQEGGQRAGAALRGDPEEDASGRGTARRARSPRSPTTTSTTCSRTERDRTMSFINYSSREINCKIVYYGPGLCGKTTNLQYIYSKTNPDLKGKMISLATETERTLFFDFLPLALGQIRGFKTRFHLYTVPGQVFYDASRKLILKGVDGVVFVADCQIERMEANIESLDNLRVNLGEQGYDLDKIPYVIQYNKRDLPNAAPLDEMRRLLNPSGVPDFEACATVGKGVFETLKAVAKGVLTDLKRMAR